MELKLYQIDAFTDRVFGGNPAAVVPLEQWLPDGLMLKIAAENNVSETAFFVPEDGRYRLRWFTPEAEINLCGHATLATAYVLFNHMAESGSRVAFETMSGPLFVERRGDLLSMDFPAWPAQAVPVPNGLAEALGVQPAGFFTNRDFLIVVENEDQVRSLRPDLAALERYEAVCIIVTAPGKGYDFISRTFAASVGLGEDPVTGSAHCSLIPYWAKRLGKSELHAYQASRRGGELFCSLQGDRVTIAGKAAFYLQGTISIPD